MKKFYSCVLVLTVFFSVTAQEVFLQDKYISENDIEALNELEVWEDAFHFYVIGDWGRNGYFKQKELAVVMHKAGFVLEPEIIISTGDNFYPDGIASTQDPYIKSSFEDIYSGFNLFVPWYVVLGNHDYIGNIQAQIDYSKISKRWNMPDYYYHIDKKIDGGGSIRFMFLDTNPFEDRYYKRKKYHQVTKQDTLAQKKWLKNKLKKSKANWNFVIGHHPLYTSGKRYNAPAYQRKHLESIFEKGKVHAYFAGHEHDLQHQKPENVFTHHFVSGAGSEVRPTNKLSFTKFAESIQGFLAVSVYKNKMLVQAVNYKGEVIYKTEIIN